MQQRGGIREAKRRATVKLIERAAVDLALERGHEQVTVEAICTEAGIARSTFFNHFHSRESAIFGSGLDLIPSDQANALLDRAAPDLLRGTFAVAMASTLDDPSAREIAALRSRITQEQPSAMVHTLRTIAIAQLALTNLLDAWLAEHPERARLPKDRLDDEAAYIVGAVTTVGLRLLHHAAPEGREAEDLEERFIELVDEFRTVIAPVDES